jgi:signal transduction histidine kinase
MNAMKYSDKKTTIEIDMNGNILSIQDSGIGMDETQLLRVYERYYQGDNKKEGEGIGLALVKAYCDEADIEVQIYSEKDMGTKVSLDLSKIIQ